ncbi:hypothetical protein HLB44_02855 [Aquincola sp. S2]|uniref:Glutathionylspermidine synthase pre-ATP-grasp-like domain-containing protein n=1 Tax=Pseudaquabacterium terrae TaxID=2732868 RepID=A0ABX2ED74_9BURK|nr:hypothetical protein [Aquabacterium terrae]NRF65920.1 hypothetical protein [Aquabacterium terrae]
MDLKNTEALVEQRLRSMSSDKRAKLSLECDRQAKLEGLEMGGQPISYLNVPVLFDRSEYQLLSARLANLLDCFVDLEEFSLTLKGAPIHARLMESLTPGGRHLVNQCTHESRASLVRRMRRIDGFWDPQTSQYSVIEINQAAPLGLHNHDALRRITSMVLAEVGVDNPTPSIAPQILEWFRLEFSDRGRQGLPRHVALVIEHGYPGKFADLPPIAQAIEKLAASTWGAELQITVCFPYDISLQNGNAVLNGKVVDMIWRNSVYMTTYREQNLPISDYESILSHHEDFIVINSTRSWLTRTKETLALFWDDAACSALGLGEEDRDAVRRLLPRTVNLKYSPEARNEICRDRGAWVSKPTDSGFGQGVEFGVNHSTQSWSALVSERSKEGFVFQKRVEASRRRALAIEPDGGLSERFLELDFCPQHVAGHFSGTAVVRGFPMSEHSAAEPMNLSRGAVLCHAAFV